MAWRSCVQGWRRHWRAGLGVLAGLAAILLLADRLFPPDLRRIDESSALVLADDETVLRAFTTTQGYWRLPATVDSVDPLYLRMLLAYEDRRFFWHPGVDPLSVLRAASQATRNGRVISGASTLTMQAARLLEPHPRTLGAKLVEMLRAVQLEAHFSKDEILGFYLTLAPYGGNLEGVRAASLAWFGKEPRYLAPSEAALLVALPQAPEAARPDRFPERARQARDKVIAAMEERGVLDPQTAAEARGDPVPTFRRDMPFMAPHLASTLVSNGSVKAIYRTTIDAELQAALENFARGAQRALDPGATLAILVVENDGRRVRGYVGSGDFFDSARDGQVDMVRAIRSPGSTLKPFIYGMAFDDLLLHPDTVVADMPTRFGNYRPENFLRSYRGEVTVREALQQSLNIPAVAVLQGVGPARMDARLRAAGIDLRYGGSGGEPGLPLALGGVGTSLLDLVTLYAGLAEGGSLAPLALLRDAAEAVPAVPLFGDTAAWYVTRILEAAPPPADFIDPARARDGLRIAFKTGTSYGYRDAWAIGYDARYTAGIWVGRPDGTPSPDRFGRETAAPLLFQAFGMLPGAGRPANAERPGGVIDAADLPAGMARYAPGSGPVDGRSLAQALEPALAITFPPDGARLEYRAGETLPLTAEGGRKPLVWLVNGLPVPSASYKRRADWNPDGAGFVNITVIDADGRSVRSEVLLR